MALRCEVKNYQKITDHGRRVILIIDNALSHPKLSKFSSDDENAKIMHFPSKCYIHNVTHGLISNKFFQILMQKTIPVIDDSSKESRRT